MNMERIVNDFRSFLKSKIQPSVIEEFIYCFQEFASEASAIGYNFESNDSQKITVIIQRLRNSGRKQGYILILKWVLKWFYEMKKFAPLQ